MHYSFRAKTRLCVCLYILACRRFNIWGHIASVPTCRSGTLTNVLPHRNAMPQTQDTTPHPVTVYRHGADLSLCYPLVWDVTQEYTATHFNVRPFPDLLQGSYDYVINNAIVNGVAYMFGFNVAFKHLRSLSRRFLLVAVILWPMCCRHRMPCWYPYTLNIRLCVLGLTRPRNRVPGLWHRSECSTEMLSWS